METCIYSYAYLSISNIYLFVYLYVCMHVCMYVCLYAYVYIYVCMYVCMYVSIYLSVCLYTYKVLYFLAQKTVMKIKISLFSIPKQQS